MLVQRENVQLTINPKDLEKYLSQGYVEVKVEKSVSKKDKKVEK